MESEFQLRNKLVVITGASSGIGRQCAISCSQMGAKLILIGRDQRRLEETLSLTENSSLHQTCLIDITEFERIAELISDVVKLHGRIYGVIHCAGISTTIPINGITSEKMELFLRTNVMGSINLTKNIVKQTNFSEDGGSIIFLSSVMGVVGEAGKTLYAITKGSLISAVKSLAVELAHRKIRVNSISPGVVISPMSDKAVYSRNEESVNKIKAMHPLGFGTPDDIANACIFLLSPASRWITGTNLVVDGGYLAR